MQADIVIVGAGHAGAQCAIALRQNGFTGTIALIGREAEPPYERPPLSKDYLARERSFERLYLRPPGFWADRAIALHLGLEVIAVDAAEKRLTLSNGAGCTYDTLVWAAGGDPRRLAVPGGTLAGVHAIRTRTDCDRLLAELDGRARDIAIVGGGYIGLEAAAVLATSGCRVTLLEAMPRVLARVAGPELSAFYEREHRDHGIDVRTGVSVTALTGEARVTGVKLGDGGIVKADAVIVGIGIVPAVAPLIAAGAAGQNGVLVDDHCRTSLAGIYAIGDCAMFASAWAGGAAIRVESIQNANDQANCVARAICGDAHPYDAFPWFWSNQYDLKLQTAGLSSRYDRSIVRGDPATRAFSVAYLKQGRLIAIDCVNMVRDYVQGRKLIEAGVTVDPADIADASTPLKALLPG